MAKCICRYLTVFLALMVSACATQSEDAAISVAKIEQSPMRPITRLAFVEDEIGPQRIMVVNAKTPTVQEVSQIETAAGEQESVIEH